MTIPPAYQAFCRQREAAQQKRSLATTVLLPDGVAARDGTRLVNFASNDYLGLSQHPALIAAAQDYAARFGAGAAASRLVTGNIGPYEDVEAALARGKGCARALVMCSGYQANLSVLAALADKDVLGKPAVILADRLIHNSLLQGAALSGARLMRYQHNDHQHLENLLQRYSGDGSPIIIVTESVFGMDGDRADLAGLITLSKKYGAMLYVDEAHATGVLGANGFGLCADFPGQIDVAMGTFGKALGSFGAYIACDEGLRDYLIQRCGGLIYSTALPPAVLGSMMAALELLPALAKERERLLRQAENLRQALTAQGWDCGASTTQIIPVIVGGEDVALQLSLRLRDQGFLAPAIRPPTVPRGSSRLRVSLSAAHDDGAIEKFIGVMGSDACRRLMPLSAQKMAS